MNKRIAWMSIAAVVCSTAAFAGALGQKKAKSDFEKAGQSDLRTVTDACGYTPKYEVDTSKMNTEEWSGYGPSCSTMGFDGVAEVCRKGPEYKEAVAKNLKVIKCVVGTGEKGSASMKGDTLTYYAVVKGDSANSTKVAAAILKEIDK